MRAILEISAYPPIFTSAISSRDNLGCRNQIRACRAHKIFGRNEAR
jgi:hypothetical protein